MRGLDGRSDGSCATLFTVSLEPGCDRLALDALRRCIQSISQGLRSKAHDHIQCSPFCVSDTATWRLRGSSALSPRPKQSHLGNAYTQPAPDCGYRPHSSRKPHIACALAADAVDKGAKSARSGDSGGANDTSGGEASTGKDKQESQGPEADAGDDEDEDEDDGSDENDEGEDEDEDDGVVRCVCGERNDGELMIQCEICQVWQHTLCMGIRDEAHIPDKYYCEKCHPEDHPYINSRPRTVVLAEASSMGTSTMMRRSAVMAVAKMSAREEYRSAAAAAAIAASVASAATERTPSSNRSRNSRRTPKKQLRQPDSATTPKSARKGGRPRRQPRETSEGEPGDSSNEDETRSGSGNGSETGSGAGAATPDGDASTRKPKSRKRGGSTAASRNGAQSKRSASTGDGPQSKRSSSTGDSSARSKRRKTGSQSLDTLAGSASGHMLAETAIKEESDEGEFAEDLVAQMMGANPQTPRSRARARTTKPRNRSASTVVKPASSGSTDCDVDASPAGAQRFDFQHDAALKRRGKSVPGSPQSPSRSPSPSLQSLLYGYGDHAPNGKPAERPGKRKRGGPSVRSSKHQRMAVSASNSPFLSGNGGFGAFSEMADGLAFEAQRNSRTASNADDKGKGANSDATDDEEDEQHEHSRQPRHNFPPQEMADINGNSFMVPSNMLSSCGQPIYSSTESDSKCRIRYPHSKASLYELNRRAKQLLEWLGKTQLDYEHERKAWLTPRASASLVVKSPIQAAETDSVAVKSPMQDDEPDIVRGPQRSRMERRLSDAPTSPINPSDWPEEDEYDGAQPMEEPTSSDQQQRSTLTIMEDLVWRLIQFQETYSN
ncbi:Histone deacetylase complex subunit [Coemansia erecta]|nr:Histone deacetylase complex subunit [Coemansia sp. RSA 2618]KAJ2830652.1 Histone deacetylase complex subunit [Coemansia erecta]